MPVHFETVGPVGLTKCVKRVVAGAWKVTTDTVRISRGETSGAPLASLDFPVPTPYGSPWLPDLPH